MSCQSDLEIYDIYDIIYTPWFKSWWFISFSILLFILISVFILYKFYNKFFINKISFEQSIKNRINNLKNDLLIDHKIFFFSVTDIVKDIFSHYFFVEIKSKTDDEFLQFLKQDYENLYKIAESIFENAQQVKFAKASLSDEKINLLIESILKFFTICQKSSSLDKKS